MPTFNSRVNITVHDSDSNLRPADVFERLIARDGIPKMQGSATGELLDVVFDADTQSEADRVMVEVFRLRQIPGTDYGANWSLPKAEGVNYYGQR